MTTSARLSVPLPYTAHSLFGSYSCTSLAVIAMSFKPWRFIWISCSNGRLEVLYGPMYPNIWKAEKVVTSIIHSQPIVHCSDGREQLTANARRKTGNLKASRLSFLPASDQSHESASDVRTLLGMKKEPRILPPSPSLISKEE